MSQKRQKGLRARKELRNCEHDAAHVLHDLASASTQPMIADLCRYYSQLLVGAIVRVDRTEKR